MQALILALELTGLWAQRGPGGSSCTLRWLMPGLPVGKQKRVLALGPPRQLQSKENARPTGGRQTGPHFLEPSPTHARGSHAWEAHWSRWVWAVSPEHWEMLCGNVRTHALSAFSAYAVASQRGKPGSGPGSGPRATGSKWQRQDLNPDLLGSGPRPLAEAWQRRAWRSGENRFRIRISRSGPKAGT